MSSILCSKETDIYENGPVKETRAHAKKDL